MVANRYTIRRETGRGGMASVFLAEDHKHEREVAIKFLLPELSAAIGAERFTREIKLVARLQHPHILPLYDSGEADGTLFFVMPYVEGESLRERLTRAGPLRLDETTRIVRQIADALDYAHGRDVVHRDLKPENILLAGGQALLADFGVARAAHAPDGGATLTSVGMTLGTPAYMSPEQAAGERTLDAHLAVVPTRPCVLRLRCHHVNARTRFGESMREICRVRSDTAASAVADAVRRVERDERDVRPATHVRAGSRAPARAPYRKSAGSPRA